MDEATRDRAILGARQVARAASLLASEAATLARVYDGHAGAMDASICASEAAVRAAEVAFMLDARAPPAQGDPLDGALRAALASVEAASVALQSTRAALDAVVAVGTRGGSSVEG